MTTSYNKRRKQLQKKYEREYDIVIRLAAKSKVADKPLKETIGSVFTNERHQLKRWAEHFGEQLNRPPPVEPVEIEPTTNPLEMDTSKPPGLEIKKAMKCLKVGKAPGPDGVPSETIKADLDIILRQKCFKLSLRKRGTRNDCPMSRSKAT